MNRPGRSSIIENKKVLPARKSLATMGSCHVRHLLHHGVSDELRDAEPVYGGDGGSGFGDERGRDCRDGGVSVAGFEPGDGRVVGGQRHSSDGGGGGAAGGAGVSGGGGVSEGLISGAGSGVFIYGGGAVSNYGTIVGGGG